MPVFSKEDFYKYIVVYYIYNFSEIYMLWQKSVLTSSVVPNIITKSLYKRINKYFYISTYIDLMDQ